MKPMTLSEVAPYFHVELNEKIRILMDRCEANDYDGAYEAATALEYTARTLKNNITFRKVNQ
jgi:hypothetical protein